MGAAGEAAWSLGNTGGGSGASAIIPTLLTQVVEDATPTLLTETYSVTLDNTSTPATSAFSVLVNSVASTVNNVTISGSTVILTLASAVVYGDVVTVSYTQPELNPLKSLSGGAVVESFENYPVTNNIEEPPIPVLVSAEIPDFNHSVIIIYFDTNIDADIFPDNEAFSITINSVETNAVYLGSVDNSIGIGRLDNSQFVYGDIVTVSYTKPETNPLKGVAGGEVESFADYPVTNNIEAPS